MEIDQVYKAPSIPKLNRRNIKSTLISGAIKPGVELKKSKFSFIKPLVKLIPDSLVPIKEDENKGSLVKNIQSGVGIQKLLEQSNKILTQIKEQLSLDFLSRINQEKKELAENKKRIAAEKVKDKERKIESGGRGLLGKTLSAVVAPAKSIFQKLLDFFSIILTGILVNSAFKWLQKPENQKKLQDFFNFLKEYWQELLIVFGAVKLLGLVRKIQKVANAIKGLIDFFKSKPKLPCNCPSSPAQKGGLPDCDPKLLDCVESLIKDPRRGPGFLQNLAQALLATKAFAPFLLLIKKPPQTATPPSLPANPQTTLQNQYRQSRQGAPAGGFTPTNVRNAQRSAQPTAPAPPQTNQQKLIAKRPWWDTLGLFGGASAEIQRQSAEEKAKEASKVSPANLNQLVLQAQEEYKNNGEKKSVWLQTKEGWAVSYGRPLTPTGDQNEFATPKVNVYTPIQTLKMDKPDPLLYLFIASNLPAIVGPVRGARSPILQQSGRTPYSRPLSGTRTVEPSLPNSTAGNRIVPSPIPRIVPTPSTNSKGGTIKAFSLGGTIRVFSLGGTVGGLDSSGVGKSKYGTIPGLEGGGTVGGPGRLGVDSIPAMIASGAKTIMGGANALLAPGEEVIRTSSAMLFRPLLKDINDNAGRLWQAFTNAVRKQNLNETIVTDLISQFGKIIEEFKDLLDKEATDIKRKNRSGGATGGGILRPSAGGGMIKKIDQGVGGLVQDVGGMIGRNQGRQTGLPGGGFIGEQLGRRQANDRYQDFTNSIRSLLDRSRSNISTPNINIQNPVNLTQNVVNPQIEKTILGEKNIYIIPVPISRESSKLSSSKSSGGNISVINLPPKVVNLTKPSQPKSLPSSPSGTSVPSISPIDESNDYIFTTPTMYGILV